jgi:hypothetical protein
MFSDENSGPILGDPDRLWLFLNMAGSHQLNSDAFAAQAATALRDSLADDLLQWQLMETWLLRASREVPTTHYARCDDTLTNAVLQSFHT